MIYRMDLPSIVALVEEIEALRVWHAQAEEKLHQAVNNGARIEPQSDPIPEEESPPKTEEESPPKTEEEVAPVEKVTSGKRKGRCPAYREWRFRRGTEDVREWRYSGASYRTLAAAMHLGTPDSGKAVWLTPMENRGIARLAVDYRSLRKARAAHGDLIDWFATFSRGAS